MNNLLDRLRALDTCALSDALDRHEISGVLLGLRSLAADRSIAGRAVTVLLGPPVPLDDAPSRHLGTAAVDASSTGDVIVVAHQGRTDCAGWGGLLSRAAAFRSVDGIVVDGAARDLAEARSVGLPIYALAGTPVTARGRAIEHAWGETVQLAGISISPGDLVRADDLGVVVVPASRADEVLSTAERIAATEAAMAEAIEGGAPVSDVMGKTYEEMTASDQ